MKKEVTAMDKWKDYQLTEYFKTMPHFPQFLTRQPTAFNNAMDIQELIATYIKFLLEVGESQAEVIRIINQFIKDQYEFLTGQQIVDVLKETLQQLYDEGWLVDVFNEMWGNDFIKWWNDILEIVGDGEYGQLVLSIDKVKKDIRGKENSLYYYNCVGDGVYDNTLEIQKAIDETEYGGTLFIPEGKYMFSDTLIISKPITLKSTNNSNNYTSSLQFKPLRKKTKRDCAISIETMPDDETSYTRHIHFESITLTYEWEHGDNQKREHDGISTKHNIGKYLVDFSFTWCNLRRFVNNIYLPKCFLGIFRHCRISSGINGFVLPGFSTSLIFENCYAEHNIEGVGYQIIDCVYSNMVSCASDNNGFGYELGRVRGFNITSCGGEGNRKTMIHLIGGCKNLKIQDIFSHENGNNATASYYGTTLHADYTSEHVVIDNINEESIHENAKNRNFSIVIGDNNKYFSISNSLLVLRTTAPNTTKFDGIMYNNFEPQENKYNKGDKIYVKHDGDTFNRINGWVCVRTGVANKNLWSKNTFYSSGVMINDGGRVFISETQGTSGSTDLSTIAVSNGYITENEIKWRYVDNKAEFLQLVENQIKNSFKPLLSYQGSNEALKGSYTIQEGHYNKIGNIVNLTLSLTIKNISNIKDSPLIIRGSGFDIDTRIAGIYGGVVASLSGVTNCTGVSCFMNAGESSIKLIKDSGGGKAGLLGSDINKESFTLGLSITINTIQ